MFLHIAQGIPRVEIEAGDAPAQKAGVEQDD